MQRRTPYLPPAFLRGLCDLRGKPSSPNAPPAPSASGLALGPGGRVPLRVSLLMAISISAQSAAKKLRRTSWSFQQTFHAPLKDLPRFVQSMLSGIGDIRGATAHIESIVFEPKALNALVAQACSMGSVEEGVEISADTSSDASALLIACLEGWIDFFFVPSPKPYIIYADHDEFTTLLAITKSGLNAGCAPLISAGFRAVEFERKW